MGPGLDFKHVILTMPILRKKRITERVVGSLSVESGLAASYIHDTNHHVVPKSMQVQTVLFRPSYSRSQNKVPVSVPFRFTMDKRVIFSSRSARSVPSV